MELALVMDQNKIRVLGGEACKLSWPHGRNRSSTTTSCSKMSRSSTMVKKTPSMKRSVKRISSWMNASISSISEDEPVLSFNDSGLSSMSSLSQLTGSSNEDSAAQLAYLNLGPVTQGPSLFETPEIELRCSTAPMMPRRSGACQPKIICTASWRKNPFPENKGSSTNHHCVDINDDASTGSLTLEDILEESNHSCSSHAATSSAATEPKQWSQSQLANCEQTVRMTPLLGSARHRDESESSNHNDSWGGESSTTICYSEDSSDLSQSFSSSSGSSSSATTNANESSKSPRNCYV